MTAIPVRSMVAIYRSWEAVSLPCDRCKSVLRVARMAGTEQLTRNGQANGNSATVSGPGNKHNPTNSPKY